MTQISLLSWHWVLFLASCVMQGAFLIRLAVHKVRGREERGAVWPYAMLATGSALGMWFAATQSDAVFMAGQGCVLILGFVGYFKSLRREL